MRRRERRIAELDIRNQRLCRAFLLYRQLRLLYALDDAWISWAARSRLQPHD